MQNAAAHLAKAEAEAKAIQMKLELGLIEEAKAAFIDFLPAGTVLY